MPKTIERPLLAGSEQLRLQAATGLHNQFVLASPAPEFVPQPGRIDRDLKRLSALTKQASIQERVTDLLGTALAINGGENKIERVYEISPVKDPVKALIDEVANSSRQRNHTLDALLTSITYLEGRGRTDANAVAKVRDLLSNFAGTLLQYDPELAIATRDEIITGKQNDAVNNSVNLRPSAVIGWGTKTDVVVDHAGVHSRDASVYPQTSSEGPVSIRRINAPMVQVVHETGFAREGATRLVSIPTAEGGPLEYAVTIVVKEGHGEDSKWRPVQLAPALSPHEVTPGNLESQQIYPWTLDLPSESTKYAVVVEATPWTYDVLKKEKGGTIYTAFSNQELERRATRAFIEALIDSHADISSAFDTFGVSKNQVNINRYGALRIREFLQQEGRDDILNMELQTLFQGSQDITRLALSFASRLGFAGNDKPTPLAVMVDANNNGGELFETSSKPDDPKEKTHEIKPTGQEKIDRNAICKALGIEEDMPGHEVFIFDQVSTYTEIKQRIQSERTPARVATRDIFTQPLARHESVGNDALASTVVEIVPLVGQNDQTQIITRPTSIHTVGDLLQYIADSNTLDLYRPNIRLQSPILVNALAAEQKAKEEQLRRLRAHSYNYDFLSGGPVMRGGAVSYGSFDTSYTGVTTVLGEREERGDADIGHRAIIGELPRITVALTTELPASPSRVKDSTRRKLIK